MYYNGDILKMKGEITWGKLQATFEADWIESFLLGGGLATGIGLLTLLGVAIF